MRHIHRGIVAWACLIASLAALAAPSSFVLGDDSTGPTCANYSSMGGLAWSRPGGDWLDAKGELHGDKAFDSQVVAAGKGRQVAEWNLTELARAWLDGRARNDGVLLRALPGRANGVVDFHSRESTDLAGRPMLKLQWADGSRSRLAPVADTFLDCTSLSSLGSRLDLKVSRGQSALLRFVLPENASSLQAATLYLVSDRQYGGGNQIGAFRVAPPYSRYANGAQKGIAEGFARDVGLEKHPDVLFSTGFERANWTAEWSEMSPRSVAEPVADDREQQFQPLSGKALRVRIPKGSNLGLDLRYLFARQGKAEPEAVYFRYYLRFGNNWVPTVDGGKLPGIAGTYGRAGWGMRKSDGYNGWSVRGAFARRPSVSTIQQTALGSYVYHADIRDSSGDYWGWSEGPSGLLENNRWYAVEQYVKLNTPGATDGIFRAWINGGQVQDRNNVRFRHTADLKIESVWVDIYHGGVAPAGQDMSLYIDNVVIARSYIGPMRP